MGTSEADLIVEKFKAQEETFALLANLHRQATRSIEMLSKEYADGHLIAAEEL